MSPLPERAYFTLTWENQTIIHFFDKKIDPDEKLIWDIHLGDLEKQMAFFESKGVNFEAKLEDSLDSGRTRDLVYFKVYPTAQKGVYLELTSDKQFSGISTAQIVKEAKHTRFYRLGEKADEEYKNSLAA